MKPLIIANLKSYKLETELKEWLEDIDNSDVLGELEIVVAPSHTHLYLIKNLKNLKKSAQNSSPFPKGAYTGEINAEQLKEYDVDYCIVGHSERRKYFNETNQQVSNKIDQLLEQNITPIVCVDKESCTNQITILEDKIRKRCIFAYEPVSSIGTGNPADPEQVREIAQLIKELTNSDQDILYGGSVDESNIEVYLNIEGINGFIIATSSLNPKEFIRVIKASNGK